MLSKEAKERIIKNNVYASFPYLIEIKRVVEDTEEVYRYVNSDVDKEFNGNIYKASSFVISPPEKRQDGFSDARLTISAIESSWIYRIRETQKRASIKFMACIDYDLETGEDFIEPIENLEFILTNASWNDEAIQWTMIFDDLINLQIPSEEMNVFIVPSLA